ncbi:hypothetical protein ACV38A_003980 [Escherichia coli]|uniref:hypothetical protein n=1 Tax=Escherichia coli TaxID=562 RepID=UPI000667EDF5|nr:hypothetical protein [Escherichia coli]EGJ8836526.1 hypothetical protein [Salmonella enterica]EGO4308605.1 hypothetical protein [Escherichia coli]EKC8925771.1 hypothetical protein [Escherichia coli]
MDYTVNHPIFGNKKVVVRIVGMRQSKLYVDDVEQKKTTIFNSKYCIQDVNNGPVMVELKSSFFNPVPVVKINDEKVRLVPRMKWYENVFAFMLLPLLFCGFLGIVVMGVGITILSFIMRSRYSALLRYSSAIMVTLGCYCTFILLAITVQHLLFT